MPPLLCRVFLRPTPCRNASTVGTALRVLNGEEYPSPPHLFPHTEGCSKSPDHRDIFYYSSEDSTVPNHGDFSPLIRLLTWNDISGAASEVMHARTRLTTHTSTASTSTPSRPPAVIRLRRCRTHCHLIGDADRPGQQVNDRCPTHRERVRNPTVPHPLYERRDAAELSWPRSAPARRCPGRARSSSPREPTSQPRRAG